MAEKLFGLPCKDEEEAKKIATAAAEAETEIQEKIKQEQRQGQQVNLTQSTPPAGVGGKLDIKTA